MPKVSVIIPVYNVEKYLRKCLDSVVNQTLTDIEIICVDDGSTDNSLAMLKEYADKDNRIKIIDKENGGLSSARNAGMDVMNGEYCYFIDSDDWINLDTIEKLIKIMAENDVDVVVHGAQNIAEDKDCEEFANKTQEWFKNREKPNGVYDVPIDVNARVMAVAWNKLYKTEIINKYHCRFKEGVIHEDELFVWTYMVHCNKYYYLNEKLYYYLRRADSIIGKKNDSIKMLDIVKIQNDIYRTVEKYKNINDYQEYLTRNYIKVVKGIFYDLPKKYKKDALTMINGYFEEINHDKRIKKLYQNCKYFSFIYSKTFKQFIASIFSVKNDIDKKYKIITILGIKIKIKRENNGK